MYSLSNNISKYIFFIISILILIIQVNIPSIVIYENNKINLDLILLFLTFLVFINNSFKIIFVAFFLGIFQDIIISNEQLGLLSFLKSFTVYLLLGIRGYDSIWSKTVKLSYIFFVYFLHFLIYYLVIHDGVYFMIFFISFIQSLVCFVIYYFFDKFFFNIK